MGYVHLGKTPFIYPSSFYNNWISTNTPFPVFRCSNSVFELSTKWRNAFSEAPQCKPSAVAKACILSEKML